MRVGLTGIAGAVLLGAAATALAVDVIRARSLAFLQARGGIEAGQPLRDGDGWTLPLACDLSGVRSLHEPGNIMHSGLAWWRSVAVIDGRRIHLTIETNVQGPDAPGPRCGPARLGHIEEGVYELLYRDPDGTLTRLGEVRVGR